MTEGAFSFRAPAEALRRRADPRSVRLAVVAATLLVAVTGFGRWVVESERTSDRQVAATEAAIAAADPAPVPTPVILDDEAARAAGSAAVAVALEVLARTGSFDEAGTGLLAEEQPDLIFVDGPSTAPAIVSIATNDRAWAAAVMGTSGSCFWVKVTAAGLIRYDAGAACTGRDALEADALTW